MTLEKNVAYRYGGMIAPWTGHSIRMLSDPEWTGYVLLYIISINRFLVALHDWYTFTCNAILD